jgi:uncharacterized protein (DUF983 family)
MHQPHSSTLESLTNPAPPALRASWLQAVGRGIAQRCPACGKGALYRRYLKVNDVCLSCGIAVGEIRSDDAPPYFTILLVGHIVVPLMLTLEVLRHPPEWVHMALWVPLALLLTFAFLPRVKGAVIALHWVNKIRG